ncbi:MAG: hypothetical protein NEHIOOID_00702 [Holosporales bacterium]
MKILYLIKFVLYCLLLIGTVFFVNMFSGHVQFSINHVTVEMPLSYFVVISLLFGLVCIMLRGLWNFLWMIPQKYTTFLQKKRHNKVTNLIIESFCALQAKQYDEAFSNAQNAIALEPQNPAAKILSGQSAQLTHQWDVAQQIYEEMAKEPRLAFIGVSGLIHVYKKKKDYIKLDQLLVKAFQLRHDSPLVIEETLRNDLKLLEKNYQTVRDKNLLSKMLKKDDWLRHHCLQSYILAKKHISLHDHTLAKDLLKKCLSDVPEFLPAALLLVRICQESDLKIYKLLCKTAKLVPHPALLDGLMTTGGFESAQMAYKTLVDVLDVQHYESQLFLSKVAFDAHHFDAARQLCESACQNFPTQRAKKQLSMILKSMNNDVSFLSPIPIIADSKWICAQCSQENTTYHIFCTHCDAHNHIHYVPPKQTPTVIPQISTVHLKAVP